MRELAFVRHLTGQLTPTRADTRLALGDDAAIIQPGNQALAVTTDTLIEGRHFPHGTAAFDVGYKALAVNCSDLAAMAAEPAWVTVALTVPTLDSHWCDEFVAGARAAGGGAAVDLIGGDTTRGALSVTVTAVGTVDAGCATYRHAACAGDMVAVTGTLGDAAAGLSCLDADTRALTRDQAELVSRLNRPSWRRGAALAGVANAAVDVSDGLLADLGHILAASDVGARIDLDALPLSMALANWVGGDIDARRRLQATGGDDYELCLTLPPACFEQAQAALGCALTPIGEIVADTGLQLCAGDGTPFDPAALGSVGWDHFAAADAADKSS